MPEEEEEEEMLDPCFYLFSAGIRKAQNPQNWKSKPKIPHKLTSEANENDRHGNAGPSGSHAYD